MRAYLCIVAVAGLLAVSTVQAEDRADLEGTQILGSRELPKVLYIVPWRPPVTGDLIGRPVESLMDEALAPVDRDVFQRQVRFHDALQAHDSTRTGK